MFESSHTPNGADAFITKQIAGPVADGPLTGWTVAVKDNIDVAGMATTGGTLALKNNIAESDSSVITKIREAGGQIVGKTLMHELGHGITGINRSYGTTLNPFDNQKTVGGSSGGSALAVYTGEARIALGTDTGGSVRIPAAYLGLVGFRPSTGTYPSDGVLHICPSRDTVGVIAKNVNDVVIADSVVRSGGESSPFSNQTIGVTEESLEELPKKDLDLFWDAYERLQEGGLSLETLEIRRSADLLFELGLVLVQYETVGAVKSYLESLNSGVSIDELIDTSESPDVKAFLVDGIENRCTEAEYLAAKSEIKKIQNQFLSEAAELNVNALVFPTVTVPAPMAQGASTGEYLKKTVKNSTPATLFGTPAINLPFKEISSAEVPQALTFEHLFTQDQDLLKLALKAEEILKI